MSLLAPLWLLLTAAAAVPLLVHLLRRRSGAAVEFPAARYLARAEREHSRSLRLRNLLVMLLRVLAVLLIAFAAARPAARWGGFASGGRVPTALAIVLDNSLSTSVVEDGRPAFEALRSAASGAAAAAGPADRVWVVTADAAVGGGTREAALGFIARLQPLHGAADPGAAVRRAAAIAGGAPRLAPRVLVITDGQRTAWPEEMELPGAVPVTVAAAPGAPPPNRAVLDVRAQPLRWSYQGSVSVRVLAEDSVPFRVLLADGSGVRTVARGVASPRAETIVRASAPDTGWIAGRVEIEADELRGDDMRHFAVWAGQPPGVEAAAGAGTFVRSALEVLQSTRQVRRGDRIRVAPADEIGAAGGALFITAPAVPGQLGAANQALARRGIPWRFGGRGAAGTLDGDRALQGTRVSVAYALVPTAATAVDTIATLNGSIWAVGGIAEGRRYVLLASPLMPEATDLPVRAQFVPWFAGVLSERLHGAPGGVLEAAPGSSVHRPSWADSLVLVSGATLALRGDMVTAPPEPGVHFFSRDGARTGALVVNVEESESVLDRMGAGELAERIGGEQVTAASLGGSGAGVLYAGAAARSLVPAALAAVLLLLGAEAVGTAALGAIRRTREAA